MQYHQLQKFHTQPVPWRFVAMLLSVVFCLFIETVAAKDIIKVNKRHSDQDTRSYYPYAVLAKALEESVDKYGDYEVKIAEHVLPNHRTLDFLQDGDLVNVVMVVTTPKWEERSIPIRIPLRLGALAFRLLAINKNNQAKFANLTDLQGLKKLTVGLNRNWATWDLMNYLGFNIASVYSYEALFGMLAKGRFDYIPRGVHEIYDEIDIRSVKMPELMIEPDVALYIPAPFYMFVSPNYPHIAERLTYGLEKMVKSGKLREMFYQHYGSSFVKAKLQERRIINIGNPLLPKETPLHRKELWIEEIQNGQFH